VSSVLCGTVFVLVDGDCSRIVIDYSVDGHILNRGLTSPFEYDFIVKGDKYRILHANEEAITFESVKSSSFDCVDQSRRSHCGNWSSGADVIVSKVVFYATVIEGTKSSVLDESGAILFEVVWLPECHTAIADCRVVTRRAKRSLDI
jgi:hypothetical protein